MTASEGDLYNVSNPYEGWKYDFGPSAFDIRNNFFTNFVYRIPLLKNSGNGLLRTTLGGWEDFGHRHGHFRSSTEYRISRPKCGEYRSEYSQPSRRNWHNEESSYRPRVVRYLCLFHASPRNLGNEPHNGVRGPGRDNWNISFFKNFPFNEDRGTNLQFRAEFFNIWNHPQWVGDTLNGGISTGSGPAFGAVTSAYDPRTIQLALKFFV